MFFQVVFFKRFFNLLNWIPDLAAALEGEHGPDVVLGLRARSHDGEGQVADPVRGTVNLKISWTQLLYSGGMNLAKFLEICPRDVQKVQDELDLSIPKVSKVAIFRVIVQVMAF